MIKIKSNTFNNTTTHLERHPNKSLNLFDGRIDYLRASLQLKVIAASFCDSMAYGNISRSTEATGQLILDRQYIVSLLVIPQL